MQVTVLVLVDGNVVFSLPTGNANGHSHGTSPGKRDMPAVAEAISNAHNFCQIELARFNDFDRMSHGRRSASQIDSDIPVAVVRDSE